MSEEEAATTPQQKCPFLHSNNGTSNKDWWPERLNLNILSQHNDKTNPTDGIGIGGDKKFDYGRAFEALDLNAVKEDLSVLMTDSKEWWPADYGHYGPFFVRMAWHSAGTYRIHDGRGGAGAGQLRFAPLNSWPDNGNLDKARRLLWPIKQKHGLSISWADLLILAGNVALESMGFATFGFAGGREDVWEPEDDVNWGRETTWLSDDGRYAAASGTTTTTTKTAEERNRLENPLAAVQMGLIYVNPEGPGSNADPLSSAHDIRTTFSRMAMDDVETVALIAGGHTFGKCHGAGDPSNVGVEPEGGALEDVGLGWKNGYKSGVGGDAITSGLEGAWTENPIKWDRGYFEVLFGYEWEKTTSPAGATQWRPKGGTGEGTVPDAHGGNRHAPMMLTSDLALLVDPEYRTIAERFRDHPEELAAAFGKAWYKLTHRDMGPYPRCLGPEVPPPQPWQDPLPPVTHPLVTAAEQAELKASLLRTGISPARLVTTAWASASTYRNSDKRGGANGARIRLAPMKDWAVNEPRELAKVLHALEGVRDEFRRGGRREVSTADLIVLGGIAGVEAAASAAGYEIAVPFTPGRTDAVQGDTDVDSFRVLEPRHDGFRNYLGPELEGREDVRAEELLVDRAYLLSLTVVETTVLVGGLRSLGVGTTPTAAAGGDGRRLTNRFFVSLLSADNVWTKISASPTLYRATSRTSGTAVATGTRVDLVFGSHSVLRALAEVYACEKEEGFFVEAFGRAFGKVMDLDRFDVVARKRVCSRL